MRRAYILCTAAFAIPVAATLGIAWNLWRESQRLAEDAGAARRLAESFVGQTLATVKRTKGLEADAAEMQRRQQEAEANFSDGQRRWSAVLRAQFALAAEPQPPSAGAAVSPALYDTVSRPYFRALLTDPEYAKAAAVLVRERINAKYGRLYTALALAPDAQDRLESYLTEKEMAGADALALMGTNSAVTDRLAALADTRAAITREMSASLGVDTMVALRTFERVAGYYTVADELRDRVSYIGSPLTSQQADQFVKAISRTLGVSGGSQYWAVPDAALSQLKTSLTPAQIAVLEEIQQEQLTAIAARDKRTEKNTH